MTADGTPVFADNAESADSGWTALKVGPYNFGFSTTRPDWVEYYPYQNGLLIWKWDTSQAGNDTNSANGHPGSGLILPIYSHPKAMKWSDGTLMRNRMQAYDSPFSLYGTDGRRREGH